MKKIKTIRYEKILKKVYIEIQRKTAETKQIIKASARQNSNNLVKILIFC